MKNIFLKTGLTLLCLIIGLGSAWGEDKTIVINTTNSGVNGSYRDYTFDVDNVTFGCTQWMKNNTIQAKKSITNSLYNVDEIPGKIKSITFVQAQTARAITVYGGTSQKPTNQISSPTTAATMTFDFTGKNYTYFSVTTPGNAVYFSQITITYEESSTPTKTLSSIAVKTAPNKVTYTEGETFDPAGLVITGTYSDSSTEDIAYADHAADFTFNPALTTALTTSNTSVTITYGSKTTTQSITVNEVPKHTANFYSNGSLYTSEQYTEGAAITFPTGLDDINGKKFMGWVSSPIDGTTDTAPDFVKSATMGTDDVTYYAVYATQTGSESSEPTLVNSTSGLVAGNTYYIAASATYASTATAMGANTEDKNNFPATSFQYAVPLTLGGNATDGWTFSYTDGGTTYYLDPTSTTGSNYLKRSESVTNYGKFSISFSSDAAVITSMGKDSRNILRYNSSSTCFACYSSGQGNVYLFAEGGGTSYSGYCTTIGSETPTITAESTLSLPASESDGTFNVTWTNVEEYDATLYADAACTSKIEDCDWLIIELTSSKNIDYYASANMSTSPRTVYMQLYGVAADGTTDATKVVTITQAGKQASDPTISNFIKTSSIELTVGAVPYDVRQCLNIPNDYDTSTYAITTTINGLTQKDGEYACVYPYIAFSKAGEYTVHVVAAAMPGKYAQTEGDITVNVTAPAAPITTIPDLFTKATEVGGTETDINITFNNWVVSGVKGSNAYVTDGTNGFIIYQSDHGFTAGNVLNGTVACKVKLYNGAAEIVGLTSTTTGLTVSTSAEELTPTVISDITTLSGVNTGALIKINNVQYNGTNFTDGTNNIKPYASIMTSLPELTNGAYYNVTGVYVQYNTTKEIAPRSAEDVEEIQAEKYAINIAPCTNGTVTASLEEAAEGVEVTLTVTPDSGYQLSNLTVTNASTSEEITVTGNKFIMPAANVNVTATFEESTPSDIIFYESFDSNKGTGGNDEKWSGSIATNDLSTKETTFSDWTFENGKGADRCAKFGAGSAKGSATTPALNYAGDATLTFKAGAWNGSTEGTTLNISIEGGGSASPTSVTLTKGAWDEYTITLTGLTTTSKIKFVAKNTSNNRFFLDEVTVTKSSITPATEYDITIASDIENGTISASKAKAEEGDNITITTTPTTGYHLASLYYTEEGDATQHPITATDNVYSFTMPAANVTVSATFEEDAKYTVTLDPQAGTCEDATLEEAVSGEGVTLPAATCLNKEYVFAGWATEICAETTTKPTLYEANSTYNPTSDITLYAVYTTEGGTADNKFDKLTALANLKSGDEIVIVNNASNYVLDGNSLGGSTEQSTIADAASIYVSDASKIWTATTTGSNVWQFENSITKIGISSLPGADKKAYLWVDGINNTWNIEASNTSNCWTIINTGEKEGGHAAIEIVFDEKYEDGDKWYAINKANPDFDDYCANRIYVKAPGAAQIYNSNPCEFLALRAIDDDKATRWATYSNDENDVEFIEGATVYSVTAENGKITLYEESDIVPAGTGVLLKFTESSVRYVTTENADALKNTNNMLRPSSAPMNDSGYMYYKLAYEPGGSKTGLGFYYGAEDGAPFVSAAGLAYLAIPASQEIRGFSFGEALIETAISTVATEVKPSANTYDLQGRLTKANTRGLFIVNGKKIIK